VDKSSLTIDATLRSSGGKQIDDVLDSCVGAMIGGFQLAGRAMMLDGAVVEAVMGEWAAEPFVEEEEEQSHLNAFRDEAVGVSGSIPADKIADTA
jgi:hypothetical protein